MPSACRPCVGTTAAIGPSFGDHIHADAAPKSQLVVAAARCPRRRTRFRRFSMWAVLAMLVVFPTPFTPTKV